MCDGKIVDTFTEHVLSTNLKRITELTLAVILIASGYENPFFSLKCTVITRISIKFDSCKLRQNCDPGKL